MPLPEIRRHWPREDFGVRDKSSIGDHNRLIQVERTILALQPTWSKHEWFQSQALRLTVSLVQIYHLVVSQEGSAEPPWAVLFVVSLCAAAIFASFGLFAAPNMTVLASFVIAALAVRPPCS